ncbi:MAG: hypothetical protein IJX80_05430 [Clostridia bacterium]|nr:hypothetical protein [Clostridia bacterium]
MGTIDWQAVMQGLAEIDFKAIFNFESKPEPCRPDYEAYCVSVGRYLIGLFNNFKNGGKT